LIGTFNDADKKLVFQEWRFSIEDYLQSFPEISSREAILFVSQRLEGAAKTWYQSQVRGLGVVFRDHMQLLDALEIFTNAGKLPTRDRDLLAALKQTSSVTDFIQRLSNITARLTITDDEAQDRFRRGLKKEIRSKVDSTSLIWTDLATMQSEALKQEGVTNYQSTGAPVTFGDGMDVDATEIYAAEIVKKPFKKLTDGERNFLTKNNGCFRCRKINVDHRANTCPSFQLAAQQNVETLEVAVASIASDVGVFSEDFDRYDITVLAPPLRPTTIHGTKSDLNSENLKRPPLFHAFSQKKKYYLANYLEFFVGD